MMQTIDQQKLTGERALFKSEDLIITNSIFADGESPLKESNDITIRNSIFKWKYPLWYCDNIQVTNSTLLETARAGIWYTHQISISDSVIKAPKTIFFKSHYSSQNNLRICPKFYSNKISVFNPFIQSLS